MSRRWAAVAVLAALADSTADSGSDVESVSPEYQQVLDIPLPQPTESSLRDAIYAAPLERLQHLLLEITSSNDQAHAEAVARLLKPIAGSNGKKRKAYETCKNCNEDYDVDRNPLGVCIYHEGTREYDNSEDFWADHDDDCHGNPDDLMDEPDFAEGFTWNCCQQTTEAEGCVKSRHIPTMQVGKRRA